MKPLQGDLTGPTRKLVKWNSQCIYIYIHAIWFIYIYVYTSTISITLEILFFQQGMWGINVYKWWMFHSYLKLKVLRCLLKTWFSPSPHQRAVLRFDIHYCVLWHTNLDESHLWCHSAYRPLSLIFRHQVSCLPKWWEVRFPTFQWKPNIMKKIGGPFLRCSFWGSIFYGVFLGGSGEDLMFSCQWGGFPRCPWKKKVCRGARRCLRDFESNE